MTLGDFLGGARPNPDASLRRITRLARGLLRRPRGLDRALDVTREVAPDGREGALAWETLASRGLIPDAWVGDSRRRFATTCRACGGSGRTIGPSPGVYGLCEACEGRGYQLVPGDAPPFPAAAAWLAADPAATLTAEDFAAEATTRAQERLATHWAESGVGDVPQLDPGPVWWFHEALPRTPEGWNGPLELAGSGRNTVLGRGGVEVARAGTLDAQWSATFSAAVPMELLDLSPSFGTGGYTPREALVRAAAWQVRAVALGRSFVHAARDPLAPLLEVWALGFGALFPAQPWMVGPHVGEPVLCVCLDLPPPRAR